MVQESKDTLSNNSENTPNTEFDQPPIFSSWNGWYALVLGVLVGLIILFYWFTKHFA